MLSEAAHLVGGFWCIFGGTQVQANVRCCLWLTLGNLFGVRKQSTVCGCLCWAWMCMGRTKLCTKSSFYQHQALDQVSKRPSAPWDLPPPASACWLPHRLIGWKDTVWRYVGCFKRHDLAMLDFGMLKSSQQFWMSSKYDYWYVSYIFRQ